MTRETHLVWPAGQVTSSAMCYVPTHHRPPPTRQLYAMNNCQLFGTRFPSLKSPPQPRSQPHPLPLYRVTERGNGSRHIALHTSNERLTFLRQDSFALDVFDRFPSDFLFHPFNSLFFQQSPTRTHVPEVQVLIDSSGFWLRILFH